LYRQDFAGNYIDGGDRQTAKERAPHGARSRMGISDGLALAAFTAGLGRAFRVVGEVAAAVLAALMPCLGRALRVIGEISTALLATFMASPGSAFAILGKIAPAATMLSHEYLLRLGAFT
jgi:hypothetical protein